MRKKKWVVPNYNIFKLKEKRTKYCLLIPVLNEGNRFFLQLDKVKSFYNKIDIIIADGGSSDDSVNLSTLRRKNISTLLVKKKIGGLSAQLRMGFEYALNLSYLGIITVDGNNKDNLNSIPSFIKELDRGYDFVQGSRYLKGGKSINTPLIRTLAIKFIHVPIINYISEFKFTDTTNGFRAYSSKYLLHSDVQPFRDLFKTYELLGYLSVKAPELGLLTKEIPTIRSYPPKGQVPTKIKGFKGNFVLLKILFLLYLNAFDPKN
jgi:dolichol-phosphate mannosyltransferase